MPNPVEELSETSRRLILSTLKNQSKTVNEIVEETKLKQPNVSNHLSRMRMRGIVKANKVGRQVHYQLASEEIQALVQSVVTIKRITGGELNYDSLIERLMSASTRGDEEGANSVLEEAFQSNAPLLDIYDCLLAPTMRRVGQSYRAGEIDEAQEHMASEITLRLMSRTVRVPGPPKKIGKSAVIGCVPNDYHTIGARMAADFLRLSGWKTLFCGANVPIRSFLTAVFQNRPNLALVSCAVEDGYVATERLVKELHYLRTNREHFSIGIGGNLPSDVVAKLRDAGADFVSRDLRQFASDIVPMIEKTGAVPPEVAWAS